MIIAWRFFDLISSTTSTSLCKVFVQLYTGYLFLNRSDYFSALGQYGVWAYQEASCCRF